MCTKFVSDGAIHSHYSPYDSAYEAFTNYMNVLSDFIVRVKEQYPDTIENEELNSLITTIRNQASEIDVLKKELKIAKEERAAKKVTAQPSKPTARRAAVKKV